jgi:hypothetical protein
MERILGSDGHPWSAAVEQGCSTLPDAEKQTQRETGNQIIGWGHNFG